MTNLSIDIPDAHQAIDAANGAAATWTMEVTYIDGSKVTVTKIIVRPKGLNEYGQLEVLGCDDASPPNPHFFAFDPKNPNVKHVRWFLVSDV